MSKQEQPEQSNSDVIQTGVAYTVAGLPIEVYADRANGTLELLVGDVVHVLNLGHVEQLDGAVRRALICLALKGRNS